MHLTPEIAAKYSKKIYGFAYEKTRSVHDAEDLSQEILLALCDRRIDFDSIGNMDAYIYRICCYTWTNYFRKNKPMWNALRQSETIDFLTAEESPEDEFLQRELYDTLRQEILYLSRLRREITVLFYYENKTGREIAHRLNIPPSTVRWHIGCVKSQLKERIEMKGQTELYTPVKLHIGHSGWVTNSSMNGLAADVLMQNICWICREKPLQVEEIARTLGVAAVYLEDKLDTLLYMDYLRTAGGGRYRTNFFIAVPRFQIETARLAMEFNLSLARPVLETVRRELPSIRRLVRIDGTFDEDFLLQALLMLYIRAAHEAVQAAVAAKLSLTAVCPKRKDGSKHWVSARLPWRESDIADEPPELQEFLRCGAMGSCVKTRQIDSAESIQMDHLFFGGWRDFDSRELRQIVRLQQIIDSGEEPNDYDKDAIAALAAKGYARVENGRPILLIPFIRKPPERLAQKITEDMTALFREKMNTAEIVDKAIANIEKLKPLIPDYPEENERNSILRGCTCSNVHAMFYMLYKQGFLRTPDEEEKKRICTLIFER